MLDKYSGEQLKNLSTDEILDIVHSYNEEKYKNKSSQPKGNYKSLVKKIKEFEVLITIVEDTLKISLDYQPIAQYLKQEGVDVADLEEDKSGLLSFYEALQKYSTKLLDSIIQSNSVENILEKDRDLLISILTNVNISHIHSLSRDDDPEKFINFLIEHNNFLSDQFIGLFINQQIEEIKAEEKVNEEVISYITENILRHHNLKSSQFYMEDSDCTETLSNKSVHVTQGDFLSEKWHPYIDTLEKILAEVKYRNNNKYEFNALMPDQRTILELQQECLQLTEEWYGNGNGNISCFYQYFIKMCEVAKITQYSYQSVGKKVSEDGYLSLLDIEEKNNFIEQNDTTYRIPYVQQGGMWSRCASDIDITNMSNIFYYKNAKQILNHKFAKRMILTVIQEMQKALLAKVHDISDIVVTKDSPTYLPALLLVRYGKIIENWGQLPSDIKNELWDKIKQAYPDPTDQDKQSIYYKFAEFNSTHPGEFFSDIKYEKKLPLEKIHLIVKAAGIWSQNLVLISRTMVENLNPRRYMVLAWERRYPLIGTRKAKHNIVLRNTGDIEKIRIMSNEMPYCKSHGLSLCSGGVIEGIEQHGTAEFEWNEPVDDHAVVRNISRDIEKMFRELKFLCPNISIKDKLPGESLINLFQNTASYSTIHATQHLHISTGSIETYPLYLLTEQPEIMSKINATIDFVRLGNKKDAFFFKVEFASLTNEKVIDFLIKLNIGLLSHFGWQDHIDIYIQLLPTNEGKYVFILEPHVRLLPLDDGTYCNPDTDEISTPKPQLVIPEGNNIRILENDMANGLDYLRNFYDINCKEGTFDYIYEFVRSY